MNKTVKKDRTTLKLRPINDQIVIAEIREESQSAGGIVIPAGDGMPSRGTVVAVGPGLWNSFMGERNPMSVKIGDEVVFPRHSGFDITIHDIEYRIFRDNEILAVVE